MLFCKSASHVRILPVLYLLRIFQDKCIALYAKGMSLRDIEKTLKEIYGVKINKDQITKLVSAVSEETESWRIAPPEFPGQREL